MQGSKLNKRDARLCAMGATGWFYPTKRIASVKGGHLKWAFEGWVIFEPGESWRKGHSELNKPVTTDGQYVLVQLWPEDNVVGITVGKVS